MRDETRETTGGDDGNTTGRLRHSRRVDRRTALRVFAATGLAGLAGCLGDDEVETDRDDETDDNSADGSADESEDDSADEDDDGDDEVSVGTAEITFLGETYTDDSASCDGDRTYPPENEQLRLRDVDAGIEFWVERHDPDESDAVDVHFSFPSGDTSETIGEVEAYSAQTTIDEIDGFELGSGTSGSLHLEPSSHMNDDVEHDPEGGEVTWEIQC
jgi:hypothetical protein